MTRKMAGVKFGQEETFDKYKYYLKSVQSPDTDVEFLQATYKELKGREPKVLREDFCGTFKICCEWVKLDSKKKAYGVDLDVEPIEYGKQNYLTQLEKQQQKRIEILNKNVLEKKLPEADLVAAMNFSYYLFHERKQLRKYFKNCYKTLAKDGLLLVDCFGGALCQEPNEEETVHEKEGFS